MNPSLRVDLELSKLNRTVISKMMCRLGIDDDGGSTFDGWRPRLLTLQPLNLERTPPHASVVASRRKRLLKNIPRNFASRPVLEMISILQLHANRCQRPDFKHSFDQSWIFTHPPTQRQLSVSLMHHGSKRRRFFDSCSSLFASDNTGSLEAALQHRCCKRSDTSTACM